MGKKKHTARTVIERLTAERNDLRHKLAVAKVALGFACQSHAALTGHTMAETIDTFVRRAQLAVQQPSTKEKQ